MKTRLVLIENRFNIHFLGRIHEILYISYKDIIKNDTFILELRSADIFKQNIVSDIDIQLNDLLPTIVVKLEESKPRFFEHYGRKMLTYKICDNILKSEIISIRQQYPEYLI